MKKVSLVVALAALCGLAASTFADVQNIRLSGDIRLRGYYLNSAGEDVGTLAQERGDTQLLAQRTRVSVEADLEDHVLVVVTLQADGIWGQATSLLGVNGVDRAWAVGVTEAYVQLRELFYSPATLKVGRQALNYGTGLIISSFDQDYNFDAGRLVLDYHPLTIDLVAAQLANGQTFQARPEGGQSDLLFLNAKYEVSGSAVKAVEGYFGWASQTVVHPQAFSTDPITTPSPMIVGLRTDLSPIEGLTASLEGAYEFGDADAGAVPVAKNISAFIANAALKYTMKGTMWSPSINAAYTFAQGGGNGGRHDFVPWFDMADGYNGYAFAPMLSNIQIFNLGASVKPCANTTLALEGYYYLKADNDSPVFSNPNANIGGLGFVTPNAVNNSSKDLGAEVDAILGYDYSKDVRCQLVYGAFLPENAYKGVASHVVNEVRGELNVKF